MPQLSSRSSTDTRSLAVGEVFGRDPARGALMLGDCRFALLPGEFIRRIHFAIVETYGDNAQDVLYRSGFEWALQSMLSLKPGGAAAPGVAGESHAANIMSILDAWWLSLARSGWGACSFAPHPTKPGVTRVILRHSAIADVLGPADDPLCHVYAGLFAGALSFVERVERHGVEVQCRAQGAATCEFLVAAPTDVDTVETWRQQGLKPAEIVERLR